MKQLDQAARAERFLTESCVTLPASMAVFLGCLNSLDSALVHRLRVLLYGGGVSLTGGALLLLRSPACRAWLVRGGWIAVLLLRLLIALPTFAGIALLFLHLAAALGG